MKIMARKSSQQKKDEKELRMRKEVLDNIFVDTDIIVGAFVGLEKEKKCLDYLFSPAINRRRLFLSSLSIAQFVAMFQRRNID